LAGHARSRYLRPFIPLIPESSLSPDPGTVFIWDFDGTLADTRLRNYRITCRLLVEAAGRRLEQLPALATVEAYERALRRYLNWRQLFTREFGFTMEETDRLGRLWSGYQLADATPVPLINGVADVVRGLNAARHGIVSQNARDHITRTLEGAGVARLFGAVIGYDSVRLTRQKPAPDGVLACLEALGAPPPARLVSVGDHETDVRSARNAGDELAQRGTGCEVIAIAVRFVDGEDPAAWDARPDFVAGSPAELLAIARGQLI
jgi:HAD superfamily hydrolase (TIGR01549 family)